MFGVDAVASVSVLEGDSVTLNSGLTEMMDDDLILWRFGSENTLIAQINVIDGSMTVYDDDLDERFRDRLMLDHQTGSLIAAMFIAVFSGECGSCDSLLVQRKQFIVQHQCV